LYFYHYYITLVNNNIFNTDTDTLIAINTENITYHYCNNSHLSHRHNTLIHWIEYIGIITLLTLILLDIITTLLILLDIINIIY